mgnify:CR=1 FL=1
MVSGFFFFKQKTAYEMLRSLVGSEMCIRDRIRTVLLAVLHSTRNQHAQAPAFSVTGALGAPFSACLLYTSDAADDLLCVDLGGRRVIQKKTTAVIHANHS